MIDGGALLFYCTTVPDDMLLSFLFLTFSLAPAISVILTTNHSSSFHHSDSNLIHIFSDMMH